MRKAFLLLFVLLLVTAIAGATDAQKEQVYQAIERFNAGNSLTDAEYLMLKEAGFGFNTPGPVIDHAGGPDAYGYIFKDSDEADGPTYNWIDITGTGTEVATGALGDDDIVGPFPIGFTFPFYGNSYTQFYVNSNGTIVFDGTYISYGNAQMPTTNYDVPFIAWFWDDLDPADGADGLVYYETIDDHLVVEYYQYDQYPNGATQYWITAEVILYSDGRIVLQYDEIQAGFDLTYESIGIQGDGSVGLSASYQTTPANYPFDDLAIEFSIMPGDANVMGYVTDGTDPIVGANVYIGNGSDVTDATGYYEIFDQFSGDNNVTIMAGGYFTYTGSVVLDPGDNDYDFQLEELPPPWQGEYFTDFEADQGFFEGNGDWEWGMPTVEPAGAYSGDNAWGTILSGDYNISKDDWLTSVTSFTAYHEDATLSYWHWYDYESYFDGYNVKISMDGGNTWQVITPVGGYPEDALYTNGEPGFSGHVGEWEYVEFDFSAYVGQEFWIAFNHLTDSSVIYSGVTIDDFFWYSGYQYQVLLTPIAGTTVNGSGGVITYGAELVNNMGDPMVFDAWTWATLPDGSNYGPIQQVPVNIQPGSTTISPLALQVPGSAPTGLYTYHAAIGDYPGTIVYEDIFYFWKVGFGAVGGEWADSDWALAMNGIGSNIELPLEYEVSAAYPNPFNPTANIRVALPDAADLSVRVYNITGQLVAEVANGQFEAGHHNLVLDGSHLASGLYFVHTQVPGQLNNVQKVTLMK